MHAYFCSTLKVGEKWKGNYIMKSHSTMLNPSPDSQHLRKLVFPLSLYHSKNILCAYLNFVPTFFHYTDVLSLNVVHSWTCLMGFFGFWFNKAFYIPRLKMSSVLSQIFDSFGNYIWFSPHMAVIFNKFARAHRWAARTLKTCRTWLFSQGRWPLFP